MKLILQNKEYELLIDYQKEIKYRDAFNDLAKRIFGISFETWYQAGFWNEKYIPYTLFYSDKAIANVSVNLMNFNTLYGVKRYIRAFSVRLHNTSISTPRSTH